MTRVFCHTLARCSRLQPTHNTRSNKPNIPPLMNAPMGTKTQCFHSPPCTLIRLTNPSITANSVPNAIVVASVFRSPDLHTVSVMRPIVISRTPKRRISDADKARDDGSVGTSYPSSEKPVRGSRRIWTPTKVGKQPKARDAKERKRLWERGIVVAVIGFPTGSLIRYGQTYLHVVYFRPMRKCSGSVTFERSELLERCRR